MNRYATAVLDVMESTMEGPNWIALTTTSLKAFLAMTMYMSMKKQPNLKICWEKQGSFFHCSIISNILTWTRIWALWWCLHITYEHIQRGDFLFDKCCQTWWLINSIRFACKA